MRQLISPAGAVLRPVRLSVRTPGFQPGKASSILARAAIVLAEGVLGSARSCLDLSTGEIPGSNDPDRRELPKGLPTSSEKRISMKRKTNTLRPRNGYVALMRLRKSGAHLKSRKAERRAETVALKRLDRDVPGRVTLSPSAPGAGRGRGGTVDAEASNTFVERCAGSSPVGSTIRSIRTRTSS